MTRYILPMAGFSRPAVVMGVWDGIEAVSCFVPQAPSRLRVSQLKLFLFASLTETRLLFTRREKRNEVTSSIYTVMIRSHFSKLE